MNWQLTEQIEEYRDEQEQLLTQLPLGGSQYMKLWYDEQKKRPCAEFVPIDNVYLPFAAGSFYTAQRVTEMQTLTEWEFKNRIRSGLYRDIDLGKITTSMTINSPAAVLFSMFIAQAERNGTPRARLGGTGLFLLALKRVLEGADVFDVGHPCSIALDVFVAERVRNLLTRRECWQRHQTLGRW
jgi:hypothetical protein